MLLFTHNVIGNHKKEPLAHRNEIRTKVTNNIWNEKVSLEYFNAMPTGPQYRRLPLKVIPFRCQKKRFNTLFRCQKSEILLFLWCQLICFTYICGWNSTCYNMNKCRIYRDSLPYSCLCCGLPYRLQIDPAAKLANSSLTFFLPFLAPNLFLLKTLHSQLTCKLIVWEFFHGQTIGGCFLFFLSGAVPRLRNPQTRVLSASPQVSWWHWFSV